MDELNKVHLIELNNLLKPYRLKSKEHKKLLINQLYIIYKEVWNDQMNKLNENERRTLKLDR